jgi:hypothetical protein
MLKALSVGRTQLAYAADHSAPNNVEAKMHQAKPPLLHTSSWFDVSLNAEAALL